MSVRIYQKDKVTDVRSLYICVDSRPAFWIPPTYKMQMTIEIIFVGNCKLNQNDMRRNRYNLYMTVFHQYR